MTMMMMMMVMVNDYDHACNGCYLVMIVMMGDNDDNGPNLM
jgi:hypothetical protein